LKVTFLMCCLEVIEHRTIAFAFVLLRSKYVVVTGSSLENHDRGYGHMASA